MKRRSTIMIFLSVLAAAGLPPCAAAQEGRAEVVALYRKAHELRQAGNLAEAAAAYEKALARAKTALGPDHADTATITNNLAFLYEELGDSARAEPLYRRALEAREQTLGKDHPATAESLNNLASLCTRAGQYDRAEPLFQRSLAIREAKLGKDHLLVAATLNNLAQLHKLRGEMTRAAPLYLRSLRIKEARLGKDDPEIALSLSNLGSFYQGMGRYRQAEAMLRRSLTIRETKLGKDHVDTGYSLNNLALLYQDMGEYARAEPLSRRTLEAWESRLGKDHLLVATALNNLALLCERTGQQARAEELYHRALRITEVRRGKGHLDLVQPLNNLAALYWHTGRLDQAADHYGRVLKILEASVLKDHPYTATTLSNLAEVLKERGDLDRAEGLLKRGLQIKEARLGKEHPSFATSLFNLAGLYLVAGKNEQAESLHRRALEIREAKLGGDHPDVGVSLNNLALVLARTRRAEEAARLCDRARRIARRHVSTVLPVLPEADQLAFLGQTDRQDSQIAFSVALAAPAGAAADKLAAAWLINGKAQAHEALARSALLARERDDPEQGKRIERLQEVRRRLSALAYAVARPGEEKAHAARRERLAAQEQELARELRQAGSGAVAAGWAELAAVRKALPAGTVLIDVARLSPLDLAAKPPVKAAPARYVAWVTGAGSGPVRIDLGPAADIDAAVERVRRALREGPALVRRKGEEEAEKALREPLEALSKRLLHPLLAQAGKAKRWLVSPDGNLWLLPWEMLLLPGGKYAVEEHTVSYLTAGRDLLAGPRGEKVVPGVPAILADPDFDGAAPAGAGPEAAHLRAVPAGLPLGRIQRLPGTAGEARAIAPALEKLAGRPPTVRTGDAASKGSLRGLRHPGVLVLATHGFFLPAAAPKGTKEGTSVGNPLLRCGLLLAGCNRASTAGEAEGVLTGLEVVGLDLRGTELVVLSACETGLGEVQTGEGVAGLRQAFQIAGAQGIVSSLWQVPDKASARLMALFFANLSGGKMNRSEALRAAKVKLIEERRDDYAAAHPFFWAAFTLTGQP
jgi:tetratricopeptide (TPR) repeat protein